MTLPRPEQPATAAGRALLDFLWDRKFDSVRFDGPELLPRILAIEREAAAAPDLVIDSTRYALAECNRVHVDEAAAAALPDVEALARALELAIGDEYSLVPIDVRRKQAAAILKVLREGP